MKNKVRAIVMVSSIILLSFFMAGCSGGKPKEESSQENQNEQVIEGSNKVALVCSAAGSNDNGYNQTAIEGLKQLEEEKSVETKVIESTTDYPGTLKTLAENGYNLIFSLEYDFTALIEGVGGEKPIAEQYPNTTFVVFNANPNLGTDGQSIHKNVISIMFNVNESSFLAGILSVMVNENNEVLFDSSKYSFTQGDDGRKLGFIGGTQSSGIEVFSFGFLEGVNYAVSEMGLDTKYKFYSTYDAGFVDIAQGSSTAGTYYAEGANIVYTVAGSVGDGVDAKAKELQKLSIQVDADKDNAQPGYVLTSVLKNTNVPVYELGSKLLDGTIGAEGGKELSYTQASGATGITDLSTIESHIKTDDTAKAKWAEIKTKLDEASEKIKDGTIKVTNAQIGEVIDMSSLSHVATP